jgi:TolA-binding protein
LFAEALRAKQRGDGAAALALYAEFLREFPDSPLAENALVQRMRLLGERDRGLAQAEAQRYLQRYPRGFAEHEARELAEPH